MGVSQSRGTRTTVSAEEFRTLCTFPEGLRVASSLNLAESALCKCNVLDWNDPQKVHVLQLLEADNVDPLIDRGVGSFMGMFIGDSLGHPFEFSAVRYGVAELNADLQPDVWHKQGYNRFHLKPGQWTDDASMGLCVADSLIEKGGQLDPRDLRLRFHNWWTLGYCNAFAFDDERTHKGSVGLGGNISESMTEFVRDGTPFTQAGDRKTSGNGSVMRNAAVPLCFHDDTQLAMQVARQQSKTTHQGDEAAECCALMTFFVTQCLRAPACERTVEAQKRFKQQIFDSLERFETALYSVQCLARAQKEERHPSNEDLDLTERKWNWKNPDWKFAEARAASNPGYIGSYAMDAMAAALHCVWTTESFTEAILKIVNMRGDADSTGSVVGQLAGALYGYKSIPQHWLAAVYKWDNGGINALKAYRLLTIRKQQ